MSSVDERPPHDCLAHPETLELVEDDRRNVQVRVCEVCGRRHVEMTVDPAVIGVEVRS